MRSTTVLMTTVLTLCSTILISTAMEARIMTSSPIEIGDEYDGEAARKIIGSRVVTSVSVVMNGKEPQFADAVGNYIPRPLVPPRVASPVSLLDPDRYEFYTFNDDGELVKRLMTMEEIQSIVANGDSEQQALAKNPTGTNIDNEANIRDIVNNVQKVLHSEMANNNFTASLMYNKLDTPDTSSSWSSILPAIFGNTGESIQANKAPITTGSTADSIIMHTTNKKPIKDKSPSTMSFSKTTVPPKTTVSKLTKHKTKPSTVTTIKPNSVTQNVKYSSTVKTTQNVNGTLPPINKTQYVPNNSTFTPKPAKLAIVSKPTGTSFSKPSTAHIQKLSTQKITHTPVKIIPTSAESISTKKPVVSKFPASTTKHPTIALKTSSSSMSSSVPSTKIPLMVETVSTKKNKVSDTKTVSPSDNTYITTILTKKKTSTTTLKPKTTKITTSIGTDELKENILTSTSNYMTSNQPLTTRKVVTSPIYLTTHTPHQTINPDSAAVIEPEPDNVFDSELSLNQIIESLKDLEGTTMPYASNYMEFLDMTTVGPDTIPPLDRFNTESITIMSNGNSLNSQSHSEKDVGEFKQSIANNVSYIPQTTIEYSQFSSTTESYHQMRNSTTSSTHYINTIPFGGIEHKESDDEMILDEKTTTESEIDTTTDSGLSKQSTNSMDNLLRESFDNVLSQVQSNGEQTTIDDNDIETTSFFHVQDLTTVKTNDKKKAVVRPTPFVPIEVLEGGATEPMKYFEAVIKHYEQEKNKSESIDRVNLSTQKLDEVSLMKTTETPVDIETKISDVEITTENWPLETSMTEKQIDQTNESFDESTSQTTTVSTANISSDFLGIENAMLASGKSTTTEPDEISTIQFVRDATEKQGLKLTTEWDEKDLATNTNVETTTTELSQEDDGGTTYIESMEQSSTVTEGIKESDENLTHTQTSHINSLNQNHVDMQYEMIQLIENIVKNISNEKIYTSSQNATNLVERKDSSNESLNKTSENVEQKESTQRDEYEFSDLGETSTTLAVKEKNHSETSKIKSNITAAAKSPLNKLKLPTLAPILNNLKMKVVNALKNTNTINLEPAPKQALGLEESTANTSDDILEFSKFCNEVAFNFWIALNNEGISSARSLTLSPFGLTSMLATLFLGARGRTSGEINDMLHLDDIVTFNPHAMLRNISESVDEKKDDNVYSSVFVRELLSDRSKGKILPFFKEKVSQFYSGYVEEVNFNTVNDIIRRRTNLLMKRYSAGKSNEYLKTSNVWVKPPLAGISANLFEMDCSKASKNERDGEMFFQVLPAIRQRRLIPIPAVVWKNGFTAGYDPELDATAVAIGLSKNIVSTIFVMPGQQGHSAPGDNLERLESVLMANAVSQNAWRRLLATLMERPGLEVQIPRFTHRSFVNTTNTLRKLGLDTLFDQNLADLRGITGSIARDMYVSDLIQINTFSTCGEDKLAEEHHVEMYPAPPNKHRTMEYKATSTPIQTVAADYENERAFASDPIYDLRYLNLPLPLRPRQARIPDVPRLRFDKPFIYVVRHNFSGMVLYFGRFNPRLLP